MKLQLGFFCAVVTSGLNGMRAAPETASPSPAGDRLSGAVCVYSDFKGMASVRFVGESRETATIRLQKNHRFLPLYIHYRE